MAIDREQMDRVVRRYWTARFDLKLQAWDRPGTKLIADEVFEGSGEIHLYRLGEHAVLRMEPALFSQMRWPGNAGGRRFSAEDVATAAPEGWTIGAGDKGLIFYMDPERFAPVDLPAGYTQRELALAEDREIIDGLCAACSEDEVEDAEIDHERPDALACGAFHEGRLVCYAGYRRFGEHAGDVGILTHPEHRRKGLGKAMVSVVTRGCMDRDVLPMYRVDADHFRSRKIAEALGYDLRLEIEVLKVDAGT